MAKLYLVRRGIESYIGPVTLSELKSAYKRMEFGLQDEVAASCGPWVALDDVSTLKRRYPELAKVVSEELLGGWGISEHSQKRIIDSPKRGSRRRSKKSKPGAVVPIVVFFLIGVAVAIYLAKSTKFSSKFFERDQYPDTNLVEPYMRNADKTQFNRAMQKVLPTLLPKVQRSRTAYNEWIPYLRLYAYNHGGVIPGFNPKLLRGMGKHAAPLDCSRDAWDERWNGIDAKVISAIDAGQDVRLDEAYTILFWDPAWIHRRQVAGWISPRNYYEGCLNMALESLRTLLNEGEEAPNREALQVIRTRLAFVKRLAIGLKPKKKTGAAITEPSKNGLLEHLSCLQAARSMSKLDQCTVAEGWSEDWISYAQLNRARVETKIFLSSKTVLTDKEVTELARLHQLQKSKDPITRFDYQPEIKFMISIMLSKGSIKEATKRVQYEYSEVNFNQP